MSDNPHDLFAVQAKEFKATLQDSRSFTPQEIASMLGSFVLAVYQQKLATQISPDSAEFMAKQTILAERLLEEMP